MEVFRILVVFSFLLNALALETSAAPFPQEPRLVYIGGDLRNFTTKQVQDLDELYNFGLNIMIVSWPANGEVNQWLQFVRANSTLRKFRYVIQPPGALYGICNGGPACNPNPTTAQLNAVLQIYVNTVLNNQDLFAGYNTFDEPALYPIPASFQVAVYNYIRARDSNITDRPIMNAHTNPRYAFPNLTNAQMITHLQQYMSLSGQDWILQDDYSPNLSAQREWYGFLNQLGYLEKPLMAILRGYRGIGSDCSPGTPPNRLIENSQNHRTALQELGKISQLKGYGYFAYWPVPKVPHGFQWGMDDCYDIRYSVLSHLTYEKKTLDSRLLPSQSNFKIEESGENILFNDWNEPEKGFAGDFAATEISGGGTLDRVIKMHPPYNGGTIVQSFPNINISPTASSYLTANIGLDAAAECGNGVKFFATASAQNVPEKEVSFFVPRQSGAKRLFLNLAPFAGRSTKIELKVNSRSNSSCDHVLISNPQIIEMNPIDERLVSTNSTWYDQNTQNRPVNDWSRQNLGMLGYPYTALVTDGSYVRSGFVVNPPFSSQSQITGYYRRTYLPTSMNSYLLVSGGMMDSPNCGDGVTLDFAVWDVANQTGANLKTVNVNRNAERLDTVVDLSDWAGKSIQLIVKVKSRGNTYCDFLALENLKLISLP